MNVEELKDWLKVEHDEEDGLLSSLLQAARDDIEAATGITEECLVDGGLLCLYDHTLKVWCAFMYEYDSQSDKSGRALDNFKGVMDMFYLKLEGKYLALKKAGKV